MLPGRPAGPLGQSLPSTAPGSAGSLGQFLSLEDQVIPVSFGEIYVGGPVSRSEQGKPGL